MNIDVMIHLANPVYTTNVRYNLILLKLKLGNSTDIR